jgi:hypothetical protein
VSGAAAALRLIGLQLLIGTFVIMWGSMLVYRAIDRGHYRAATWVIFPLTLALALVLPGDTRPLGFLAGALMAVFLAAVYSHRPLLEVASGGAASAAGLLLVTASVALNCEVACGLVLAHVLTGTLLMGAVTHGMVLGHWYLNQPRLPIEPLKGASRLILASIAASLLLGVATQGRLIEGSIASAVIVLSATSYWWVWLLLMLAIAVFALMIRSTVWIRSTQSATGLLYVAMIPAMAAQFVINLLVTS